PTEMVFSNCNCLEQAFVNYSLTDSAEQGLVSSTALAGSCYGVCDMVYAFSVLKFIAHFVDGLSVTDSKDDEAMGVGIISLFFSLAASIMGGFCGRIYESACLVATSGSAGERNCLLYDRTRLRILFNGIPMLARLPYFALLLAAYLLVKRRFGNTTGNCAEQPSENAEENCQLGDVSSKLPDNKSEQDDVETAAVAGQIQEALFCPGETIQLRCPRGHQVVVSYVFYGRRQNQWQCHLYLRQWCTDPDAVHKIRRLCQGKRSCQATADESFGLSLLMAIAIAGAVGGVNKRSSFSAEQPQLYCYEKHPEEARCNKCCEENYKLCKKELGCGKNDWRCQNPCWESMKYCDYQCKI
uniref:SUEL-type lectin domain-containing protein n=1 Tax=Macrostomum lignano TaxID=282301 RepID=A0A1I8G1Y5_9PLAT